MIINLLKNNLKSTSTTLNRTAQYLYGLNPIEIALIRNKRSFQMLYVSDSQTINISSKLKKIVLIAQKIGIPVAFRNKQYMSRLVMNQPHQNIVLKCSKIKAEYVKQPNQYGPGIYIYCDKITDPQNFGSILRSCLFFGAKNVFIPKKNSSPLNSTVCKTSAGALQLVDIEIVTKQQQFLQKWKQDAGIIISTQVSQQKLSLKLNDVSSQINTAQSKTMIILGSQGSGVSPHLSKHAEYQVTIPRTGITTQQNLLVDSLNVSSALTCLLYELTKERN